jgi:hypothetical protein
MDKISTWVESKIQECRLGDGPADGEVIQRLLSTCAALGGKGGTLFGMAYPSAGLSDGPALYKLACTTLQEHLRALEAGPLRESLIDAVLRNELDVQVPEARKAAYAKAHTSEIDLGAARDRGDKIGDLARVSDRLCRAGIDVTGYKVSEISSAEQLASIAPSLPAPLPDPVRLFLAAMPAHLYLEWSDEPGEVSGFISFELARLGEIQSDCLKQVSENLEGLEHYYRVWADSIPFMEVADGAGFVAWHRDGSVRYLDDEGDSEANGQRLASSLDDFWTRWSALGFVSIQPDSLRQLLEKDGISVGSRLGRRVSLLLKGPGRA